MVLKLLDSFVDVHLLPVLESDDEGVLELAVHFFAFDAQYLVVVGVAGIRIFIDSFFLIIGYRAKPFQPFAALGERSVGSQNLYLEDRSAVSRRLWVGRLGCLVGLRGTIGGGCLFNRYRLNRQPPPMVPRSPTRHPSLPTHNRLLTADRSSRYRF